MIVKTIEQPHCMPVSVDEIRRHLWNIFDAHDSDELFEELLVAATDHAETRLGRKLITRTMQLTIPSTGMQVVLPFGDCQGVVRWGYDLAGVATEGDMGAVTVGMQGSFAEVGLPFIEGASMARIIWKCGYGDAPADVPGDIRMAIKQLAAYWYNNRAAAVQEGETGKVTATPFTYSSLLHPYRMNFMPVEVAV